MRTFQDGLRTTAEEKGARLRAQRSHRTGFTA